MIHSGINTPHEDEVIWPEPPIEILDRITGTLELSLPRRNLCDLFRAYNSQLKVMGDYALRIGTVVRIPSCRRCRYIRRLLDICDS